MNQQIVEQLQKDIQSGAYSCVCYDENTRLYGVCGRRLLPLWELSRKHDLKGKYVGDKVIGKAAAMILIAGGAAYAYANLMSVSAQTEFEKHGVAFDCETTAATIKNAARDGMCPMEAAMQGISDPQAAVQKIDQMINGK
ncbi:MAG: DUF1893 domain-containing protein [Christensenella sp.]|uniref:DUF1893 domain-containing protein n=1 Tax=Christensenella sp. TaxID=1935934 RepID=UPI002B1FC0C3|nr:DUF1893 domain-containing protein [Christensenella sp.]MEA5002840.1 DUF1893 domain-containing protein [Christensenella sp.]